MTDDFLSGFARGYNSEKNHNAEMKARIVKLEGDVAKHRAALVKVNETLKECIFRIEAMGEGNL